MKTGIVEVLNLDKNYLIVSSGKDNIYLKPYHVIGDRNKLEIGKEIQYDKSIGGFDISSTVNLKPKVKNDS